MESNHRRLVSILLLFQLSFTRLKRLVQAATIINQFGAETKDGSHYSREHAQEQNLELPFDENTF